METTLDLREVRLPPLDTFRPHLPAVVQQHLRWLAQESEKHNLTRVPPEDWVVRHVLDSLVPFFAGWEVGERVLDLGTGPGFPGIPLAAYYANARFSLLEKRQKVAKILSGFLETSELSRRCAVHTERAEDLAHDPSHRGWYDCVVTRAVASLPCLIEIGIPFLKPGAELWCWKSDLSEIDTAARALDELHSEVVRAARYRLPDEERDRVVLGIRRCGDIPDRYPRRAGVPQKRPL
jgi:16S rRNA (guanine527-N7)-methyltransferase